MKIAIITRCPSGIANTYFASEALSRASEQLGWEYELETHTADAEQALLTEQQLADVDCVVIAATGALDLSRFVGKTVYQDSVQAPLSAPQQWLEQAVAQAQPLTADEASASVDQASSANDSTAKNIVAITACPTGVAHTFMAAEALTQAAAELGHHIKVETRGSVGAKNALTAEDIAAADVVLIAADIEVDLSPFAGKRLYRTGTGTALKQSQQTIKAALTDAEVKDANSSDESNAETTTKKKGKTGPYKHLMTGVSFMLPLVVAGGLIEALSFAFGINAFKEEGTLAYYLMQIGGSNGAMMLMIPVLAGYIAYSISDRPGIAPGLIGGLIAFHLKTGFIGGIIAGFMAGYVAKLIVSKLRLPQSVESLKPILLVPLLATLVTGLAMFYVVGDPVAWLMKTLTDFLNNMNTGNAMLLGALLGGMMCIDLGGPINKAAYTFGTGMLASGYGHMSMAAIMAGGMVPAIGLGIATLLQARKFDQSERETGRAAIVLGMCFISEGAIPFAAKDPLRVIPCTLIGGAITGALSMAWGCKLMAPHGGLFVLAIPDAISNVAGYLGAIAIGSLIIAISYAFIKKAPEKTAA